MLRLRDLQDETGGFTAFITWSFQPDHTELGGGTEATGIDYLRTLALSRIVLDNFDNLQASWVTQGGKVGQLSLAFGANDMGSVMIEENVVRAAGAGYCMDEVEIVRNIEDAGFIAEAPQHALRDPRRSDLPRARGAAHAVARHRARRRRHLGARGADELSGALEAGQGRAANDVSTASTSILQVNPSMLIASAPRGFFRSRRRRFGRWIALDAAALSRSARGERVAAVRMTRRWSIWAAGGDAGAGQRAHASRAVVDLRGACRRHERFTDVGAR